VIFLPAKGGVDVDHPSIGLRTAPEALQVHAISLEVHQHFMAHQAADGMTDGSANTRQ
jgi:hypothetical protein